MQGIQLRKFSRKSRSMALLGQQVPEGDQAHSSRAALEEVPTCLDFCEFLKIHTLYSLVMNSSRFNKTLLTPTQAAAEAGSFSSRISGGSTFAIDAGSCLKISLCCS